ncbi:MAG: DNA polymerase III subunit gamma/tau [Halothermotrichaceae bacterium]
MGFLSLYRKYRPQNFEDLVGQEHVVQTLKNAIENERIAHAYLFAGPRGTGKTSTAKIFAQALNCEKGPTPEPCGQCEVCENIQTGQSIDVIEIDAASNRGIDEIRDLREKVKFYPSEGLYKVYIIDEVHMLTKGAFNALLKTLEEPPDNVVFILATTEPHKVIETILSRCQRFDFSLLVISDIKKRLEYICQQEEVEFSEQALTVIARASNGGLRDAISLLDQAISFTNSQLTVQGIQEMLGKVDKNMLNNIFSNMVNSQTAEALETINELINSGYGISIFVDDLIEYIRLILLIKECGADSRILNYTGDMLEKLAQKSNDINTSRLLRYVEILTDVARELNYSNQPRLILEMAVVKMSSPQAEASTESLKARVVELENKILELSRAKESKKQEVLNTRQTAAVNKEKEQSKRDKKQNKLTYQKDAAVKKKKGRKNMRKAEVKDNNVDKNKQDKANDRQEKKQGTVTVDKVRKAWPLILNKVKEENIKVRAFLREGSPVRIKDNVIFIQFPSDKGFHKKGAEKEDKLIGNIINQVLNVKCEVKFILSGQDKKKVVKEAENKNVDNKKKGSRKKSAEADVVKRIVEQFNGEIIKVNHNVIKNK